MSSAPRTLTTLVFLSAFFVFVGISQVHGQSLFDMIEETLAEHDLIQAARAGKEASEQRLRQASGEWYPHVSAKANAGREHIEWPADRSSTTKNRNYQSLQARQLIYDFGRAGSGISRAKADLERSEAELAATRQDIIRQGVSVYLNVYRNVRRLELARESEKRIVELTGIEETLVDRGAGLASDVLQAKSQLAGARAVRVRAEGDLEIAMKRFQRVFGYELDGNEIKAMAIPQKPVDLIPYTLNEALSSALENSLDLYMAKRKIDMASHDIRFHRSKYFPRLQLVGELQRKENDLGVRGTREEALGMVELNWDLFSGGKDMAAVSEARHNQLKLENRKNNIERLVQEKVSIAWRNLKTTRNNAGLLHEQAQILEEFLELARHERRLSTRSLLDVLNGEVTYLNAMSNAISADIDHELAVYNMLYAMGILEMGVLR